MKRILLVSSLMVPGVLFAVERSLIYLLFISATIILYLLFVITHHKTVSERATRRLAIGQTDAETERKNILDQPLIRMLLVYLHLYTNKYLRRWRLDLEV